MTLILLALACRTKDIAYDSSPLATDDTGEGPADVDGDGFTTLDDCDDTNSAVYPGATEIPYNDLDDDCDESTVDDDLDADGYGVDEDCDDLDEGANPGAVEACDGIDNDCNGDIDDAVGDLWYADVDRDGYGDAEVSSQSCDGENGFVADDTDCDDTSADSYPGAVEICDEADNDCDGDVDEDVTTSFFVDTDGDGHGDASTSVEACALPTGYAAEGDDCDDGDEDVNPDATELCNAIDDDCDGDVDEDDAADAETWYADADSDGYGDASSSAEACSSPSGYVDNDDDCDDDDGDANPDTAWWLDHDGDGYGDADWSLASCEQPSGYVSNDDDCDDDEASAYDGASESCDEVDNDCDGSVDEGVTTSWYLDYDGDGYGDGSATEACSAPTGDYVSTDGDCDDGDTAYSPGATAGCDGEDYDCDGSVDNDGDGDGYADESCGGDDCDDSDSSVYPDAGGCALGSDCDALLAKGYGDGTYSIDPDGYATGEDAFDAICDMTVEDGGWTLIATNDWGGTWTNTLVVTDSTFGTASETSSFMGVAWTNLDFEDLMFENGSMYAVYEGVHDGSSSWYDFQATIPTDNCGTLDGYEYAMTAGDFTASNICSTNLYIHPADDDGPYYACSADNEGRGPTWSADDNNGCPLDDPEGSGFALNTWSHNPWGSSSPLTMWAR